MPAPRDVARDAELAAEMEAEECWAAQFDWQRHDLEMDDARAAGDWDRVHMLAGTAAYVRTRFGAPAERLRQLEVSRAVSEACGGSEEDRRFRNADYEYDSCQLDIRDAEWRLCELEAQRDVLRMAESDAEMRAYDPAGQDELHNAAWQLAECDQRIAKVETELEHLRDRLGWLENAVRRLRREGRGEAGNHRAEACDGFRPRAEASEMDRPDCPRDAGTLSRRTERHASSPRLPPRDELLRLDSGLAGRPRRRLTAASARPRR